MARVHRRLREPHAVWRQQICDLPSFLRNSEDPVVSIPGFTKKAIPDFKRRTLEQYELQGRGIDHIYSRAEEKGKNKKMFMVRYAAHTTDAFRIIANIHSAKHHEGASKVHEFIESHYYGISKANVRWVARCCSGCQLLRQMLLRR